MTRQFLLGTAAALLIAVPASALTMSILDGGRSVRASAAAGEDSDENSDIADAPSFSSEVNAHAMEFDPELELGDANTTHGFGAWADARAGQSSEINALSIGGKGFANASGSHGDITLTNALGDADLGPGGFEADASSSIKLLFNIDEAAAFSLSGFISAGIEQAIGLGESGSGSIASVFFGSNDDETTIFQREVFEDGLEFDEAGVIEAGDYVFSIIARANVFGGFITDLNALGDSDDTRPDFGYATSSSFSGLLELRAIDKPIPEPVTTSLVGMSLGALVFGTSRRRKA